MIAIQSKGFSVAGLTVGVNSAKNLAERLSKLDIDCRRSRNGRRTYSRHNPLFLSSVLTLGGRVCSLDTARSGRGVVFMGFDIKSDGYHAVKTECPETIKKGLPLFAVRGYGDGASAKSDAGIGLPDLYKVTHDAPASFLLSVLTHIRSMVGWVGASSEAPVSLYAGKTNSIQSTTSKIGLFSGGSKTQYKEAATWLLPLPKISRLFGLSLPFVVIYRRFPRRSTTSPHHLNRKPAAHWHGITSASSLAVCRLTGAIMNKPGFAGTDLMISARVCAALVHELVECHDATECRVWCKALLSGLGTLKQAYEADVVPLFTEGKRADPLPVLYVADYWPDDELTRDYCEALTLTLLNDTLPQNITLSLTGLLHDLVTMLADQLSLSPACIGQESRS